MKYDVLCVGDGVIDAFLMLEDTTTHAFLKKEEQQVCFQYGGKIPVEECMLLLGGNAANVSVGLSRLGLKSGIMAELGDDEFAEKIVKNLKTEGVDTSHIFTSPHQQSTFSVILVYKKERTIFTKHRKRKHNFTFDSLDTSWIYLTSLGNTWEHVYEKVLHLREDKKVKLVFNPGALQLDKGKEMVKKLFPLTDILFLNKEEAVQLLGGEKTGDTQEEIELLIQELHKMGVKTVVITNGIKGSFASEEHEEVVFCEAFDSVRIEPTGAGDSYATGFLAAVVNGHSLKHAQVWGTLNAASVVGQIGAQKGLLHREILMKQLQERGEI